MEVIGDFVFFAQGRKLLSLEIPTNKIRSHQVHTDEITSLIESKGTILTGSLDGKIVKWSLPNVSIYNISAPVLMMCATAHEIFYIKAGGFSLNRLDFITERFEQTEYFKGMLEDAVQLQVTPSFKHLALLKRYSLVLLQIETQATRTFDSNVPLNTMQVHPTADYVAVGDCTGQIIKVYEKYTTKVHWHAHKVQCLGFTNDCNFMLSGGEEGVVVIWHENSTEKSFLPRLGSAITGVRVSSENDLYIVRLINGMLKVFRTSDHKQIAGYSCLINPNRILPGSKVHKCEFDEEKGLILNGAPGFLQFYNPVSRELKLFDCENRNSILRAKEEYPYPYHVVSWVFVGDTLCTLQSSSSPYLKIQKLKFWHEGNLVSLVLHPHSDTCHSLYSFCGSLISLGNESFIMHKSKQGSWLQQHEKKLENLKPRAGCSTQTTLYISFDSVLTEWDESLTLLAHLHEPSGNPIEQILHTGDSLLFRTQDTIHLSSNQTILRSLDLGFIHHLSFSNNFFLTSLNGSPYMPTEYRKSNSNVLIKFDLSSFRPVKLYKGDHPAWTGLDIKGNTIIISKLFEVQNLDQENFFESDILPRYQKTLNEEPALVTSQKIVRSYLSKNNSSYLESFPSHLLPSGEELFDQIVLGN